MKTLFEKFKTLCCKAPLVRKGRANYRCSKCDKDNTMDYLFYAQMEEECENLKKRKEEMKTIKIAQACRNRKPFITDGKKYEILSDGENTFKIKNDLGKISYQSKSDFWKSVEEKRYGFEGMGGIMPLLVIPTPVLHYDKYGREFSFAVVLPFVGVGFTYSLKPKV